MSREMKDSGVEWIGEIPGDWGVTRLKYAYDNSNGSAVRVGPFGSALPSSDYISDGEWVYNQRTVLDENFTTNNTCVSKEKANSLSGFRVYPGDILITTRGTLGHIAVVPNGAPSGILHPCIIRFRVDLSIVMPELLKYMFNDSDFFIKQIEFANNSTTIEALYSYNLRDLILPEIPITEQSKIVHFLDRKCTAIDTAIEKTKKSIEKLEEYKKAVITKAVTKQEGWTECKLRFVANIVRGGSPRPIEAYITDGEGLNWVKIGDATGNGKYINNTKQRITRDGLNKTRLVPAGTLLLTNSMSFGHPYVLNIEGCIHDGWLAFFDFEKVTQDYLYYFLESDVAMEQFLQSVEGSVVNNLNIDKVKSSYIAFPSITEQNLIVKRLDRLCIAIDAVIEKKKKAIEKWEEYKKSLIYYAVTGKIDCRNEVI